MMMQVLIPMSGQGTRYKKVGYSQPKPLIPVSGRPMIERLLQKIPTEWPVTFVLAENHRTTELPEALLKFRPQAQQIFIPVHDKGPSYAIKAALSHLKAREPVLVSYCDYGFKWDPWDFAEFVKNSRCHSALLSYRGFHAHYLSPVTYAFSRLQGEQVVEVREKGSFTDQRENEFASAGAYYFDSVATLEKAIQTQEKLNLSVNGEFYTSLTVEALLRSQPHANVRVYEIPAFYQWGTPEDLQTFEYWEKTFNLWTHTQNHGMTVDHVHMPMAGLGSRFKDYYNTPKPFLFIDETPMYRLALNSLPQGKTTSFVSLQSVEQNLLLKNRESAHFLPETPPGQAFSVQAGLAAMPDQGAIVISACDHSIVIEPSVWDEFQKNPDCDAAIFTIKGFPGARRRPEAFAYVEVKGEIKKSSSTPSPSSLAEVESKETINKSSLPTHNKMFLEVSRVSVKQPLSADATQDHLLVGTFWFKNKTVLVKALSQLIEKNPRVNGELYLDSIFNLMIENSLKVRIIPLDGYVNWGDPDSLAEALYWKEVFLGHRLSKRQRLEGVYP